MNPPSTGGYSARSRWTRPALLAGVALAGVVGLLFHQPDPLLVESVQFVGAERAGDGALRHLSDVRTGTHLWEVDPLAVELGVERHPWVRRAHARRVLPDRVVVEVEEYRPAALLLQGGLYYVDGSGEVFLRARGDDLDYPVLVGVDASLEERHPALPRAIIREALGLVEGLDRLDLVPTEQISEVRFCETRGFEVRLRSGARLAFGLDGHQVQLSRLADLAPEVDLSQRVLVDLAPSRVAIVRPLETPTLSGGT